MASESSKSFDDLGEFVEIWLTEAPSQRERESKSLPTAVPSDTFAPRWHAPASVTGSPITIEFGRQALRDLIRTYESTPNIEAIQRVVSDCFRIHLADLKSKKRTQRIAFCCQVAMCLCRKITSNSFPSIGEHFGRDHSSVIHAFNLIERRVNNDSAFRFSI